MYCKGLLSPFQSVPVLPREVRPSVESVSDLLERQRIRLLIEIETQKDIFSPVFVENDLEVCAHRSPPVAENISDLFKTFSMLIPSFDIHQSEKRYHTAIMSEAEVNRRRIRRKSFIRVIKKSLKHVVGIERAA